MSLNDLSLSTRGLRVAHLVVGLLGFAVFLLTGQYMHWFQAHLQGMADGPRLLHRSVHIYVLWSSLLNLVLGCYLTPLRLAFLRAVQWVAGLALLAGPFLLTASFFMESHDPLLVRPVTRWAIYLALIGAGLHAVASLWPHAGRPPREGEGATAPQRLGGPGSAG